MKLLVHYSVFAVLLCFEAHFLWAAPAGDAKGKLKTASWELMNETAYSGGKTGVAIPASGTKNARKALKKTPHAKYAITNSGKITANFQMPEDPPVVSNTSLTQCESSISPGTADFMLTDADDDVYAGTGVTITYHATQADADNGLGLCDVVAFKARQFK
ncbi:hypothetical protein C7N43_07520 [Sphingobacteriales bacterium UPWRP_1]|nr:hypothetical protein B6N25_08840 [Sphingobacteriales bacterium TSM_CSS]PSJ77618.1 hypothetical protein C7N43_07520 [Sphingobacteriales bacterium UPWRP_1]